MEENVISKIPPSSALPYKALGLKVNTFKKTELVAIRY